MTDTPLTAREKRLALAAEILARDPLSRADVSTLQRVLQIRELPPPPTSGQWGEATATWTGAVIREWLESLPLQRSAAADLETLSRSLATTFAPRTLNLDARTVETVASTEQPVVMFDYRTGQAIDEVLVASGATGHDRGVPLLVDHDRTTLALVGTARGFRATGDELHATLSFASNTDGERALQLVAEGHLRSVSVGYQLLSFEIIRPGESQTIAGVRYTAGKRSLRVVTSWRVLEVSLVPIPADDRAQIRSNSQVTAILRSEARTAPARDEFVSAALLRLGVSDPSRSRWRTEHGRQTPVAADLASEQAAELGRRWSNRSIFEILCEAARAEDPSFPDDPAPALAWLHQRASGSLSSMSTGAFGAVLDDVLASLTLSAFDDAGDSTAGWCSEFELVTTKDTKTVLLSSVGADKVLRGGTAPHVSPELTEVDAFGLTRFGAQFVVDEQDLLGDNAEQILREVPRALGQAAAAKRPELVYSLLLGNPTLADSVALFDASRGNVISNSALDATKLAAAIASLRKQRDNAADMNLRTDAIVVPAALEATAAKLLRELDSEAITLPMLRADARLDNGLTHPVSGATLAGSPTTWYAVNRKALGVGYLEGRRRPKITTQFLTLGRFGWSVDVSHYLAAAAIDPRAIRQCVA